MSNMYSQFNIRGRTNTAASCQANAPAGGMTNAPTSVNPSLGAVRLQFSSPTGSSQSMLTVPVAAALDYCSPGGSRAFMMNHSAGMGIVPNHNQPFLPYGPVTMPHDPSVRMYAPERAGNMPYLQPSQTAVMLPNRLPAVQLPTAPLRPIGPPNMHQASLLGSIIPTTNTPSGGAGMPFRQVRWMPPVADETGMPELPFTVEIKPEGVAVPQQLQQQQQQALGWLMSTFTSQAAVQQPLASAPAVYLDIAMDSSVQRIKTEDAGGTSMKSDETVCTSSTNVTDIGPNVVAGKRKTAARSAGATKILKLHECGSPCVVSVAPVEPVPVVSSESNSSDTLSVDSSVDTQSAHSSDDTLSANSSLDTLSADDGEGKVQACDRKTAGNSRNVEGTVANVEGGEKEPNDADDIVGTVPEIPTITEIVHIAVPPLRISTNTDQLIASDEDIGSDDDRSVEPESGLQDADADKETSECYEVFRTSSDMPFDMECDGKGDGGEVLRVLLPSSKVKPTFAKSRPSPRMQKKSPPIRERPLQPIRPKSTRSTRSRSFVTDDSDSELPEGDPSPPPPPHSETTPPTDDEATGVSKIVEAVASSNLAAQKNEVSGRTVASLLAARSNSDDVIIVETYSPAGQTAAKQTAVTAPHGNVSVQGAIIKDSVNCFLDVTVQSSFFRFEVQCSEVYRLLSMEREQVPVKALRLLADLVGSVVEGMPDSEGPCVGSGVRRTLMYQCLFCPYGEMSAKRVVAHVKLQHGKYTPFLHSRLMPTARVPLQMYCRHCNFVTYDNAVMWVHFVAFHRVSSIGGHLPRLLKQTSSAAPPIDPKTLARKFPFYCCPECKYIDTVRSRMIHHVITHHSARSVFLGCVARLVMVTHAAQQGQCPSYESFAREPRHREARRQIYACVSCRFFSYYPTYAFNHYVVSHHSVQMVYACAVGSCDKQFGTLEAIAMHMQHSHAEVGRQQPFKCSMTLIDWTTLEQLNIARGMLTTADVPRRVHHRSAAASPIPADQIVLDDDDDDEGEDDRSNGGKDDDIVVLTPTAEDTDDDVEPDAVSGTEPLAEIRESGSTEAPMRDRSLEPCNISPRPSTNVTADDVILVETTAETRQGEASKEKSNIIPVPVKSVSLDSAESSPRTEPVDEPSDVDVYRNNRDVDSCFQEDSLNGKMDGVTHHSTVAEHSSATDGSSTVKDAEPTAENNGSVSNESQSTEDQSGMDFEQDDNVEPGMTSCHAPVETLLERLDRDLGQEPINGTDENDSSLLPHNSSDNLSDTAEPCRQSTDTAGPAADTHCIDPEEIPGEDPKSPTSDGAEIPEEDTRRVSLHQKSTPADTDRVDPEELLDEDPKSPTSDGAGIEGVVDRDSVRSDHSSGTTPVRRSDSLLPDQSAVSDDSNNTVLNDVSAEFQLFNADSALSEIVRVFPEGLGDGGDLSDLEPALPPEPDQVDRRLYDADEDELLQLSDELPGTVTSEDRSLATSPVDTTATSLPNSSGTEFSELPSASAPSERILDNSEQSSISPSGPKADSAISSLSPLQSKCGSSCETLSPTGKGMPGTNCERSPSAAPVDRSRFKSLAGFRFSVPRSCDSKPS